jgi:hypothetical protein
VDRAALPPLLPLLVTLAANGFLVARATGLCNAGQRTVERGNKVRTLVA